MGSSKIARGKQKARGEIFSSAGEETVKNTASENGGSKKNCFLRGSSSAHFSWYLLFSEGIRQQITIKYATQKNLTLNYNNAHYENRRRKSHEQSHSKDTVQNIS